MANDGSEKTRILSYARQCVAKPLYRKVADNNLSQHQYGQWTREICQIFLNIVMFFLTSASWYCRKLLQKIKKIILQVIRSNIYTHQYTLWFFWLRQTTSNSSVHNNMFKVSIKTTSSQPLLQTALLSNSLWKKLFKSRI